MSEHKFDPPTKDLSGRLYDLAGFRKLLRRHEIEQCAERLDAQTVVINGQAKRIDELEKALADERERCAKICEDQMNEPECPQRAQYCADAIRESELKELSSESAG